MVIRDRCPQCGSTCYKKNGHLPTGKQNYRCQRCGRQFVRQAEDCQITPEQRALIKRLLQERLSLRGICRAVEVSLPWLLSFVAACYEAAPDDLNIQLPEQPQNVIVQRLDVEGDELWSFVGKKSNPPWLWLALEVRTRQVIAFYLGDRSRKSARQLWRKIPAVYRDHATFYTDGCASYQDVIPQNQHQAITKRSRKTNHIERLNCTLRQRVSRLVRATLSFSKKLDNHIGAIKYFLCHYNLMQLPALAL